MTVTDPNAPAEPRLLSPADLKPADVLLARGHGVISDLITAADGGSYSHGALWSGSNVIQATSAGITDSPTEGEFTVYRHQELDSEGAAEVVQFAEGQLGGQYAYTELVLLGLLFSAGLRVKGALLDRVLASIGGTPASKLKAWLDERASQKVRVCTELVAASYYYTKRNRFALQILPYAKRPARALATAASPALSATPPRTRGIPTAQPSDRELAAAQVACLAMLTDHGWAPSESAPPAAAPAIARAPAVKTRKIGMGTIAFVAGTHDQLGVVTPADLQFSPSLQFVGYFTATKPSVVSAQ